MSLVRHDLAGAGDSFFEAHVHLTIVVGVGSVGEHQEDARLALTGLGFLGIKREGFDFR